MAQWRARVGERLFSLRHRLMRLSVLRQECLFGIGYTDIGLEISLNGSFLIS